MENVAVLGAGLAGLAAARVLAGTTECVTVFDKGRGPGGRTARRRAEPFRFDHGAPCFTARDARFREVVARWREAGIVEPWTAAAATAAAHGAGRLEPCADDEIRYVGVPGMSAVAKALAAGLDLRCGVRAATVARDDGRWRVLGGDGSDLGAFDAVLVATPAPQAVPLLASSPALAARAAAVRMDPCWTALLGFEEPLPVRCDAVLFEDGGTVGWAARDRSKPGRPPHEAWVVHAARAWSAARADASRDEIATPLLEAFFAGVGVEPVPPAVLQIHLWRHAGAPEPLGEPCLWDPDEGLGACGDWCLGDRVEHAFASGVALGERVAGVRAGADAFAAARA